MKVVKMDCKHSTHRKPVTGLRFSMPHDRLLNLPVPTNTTINESMYDTVPSPLDKRHENMFLTADRRVSDDLPEDTLTCVINSDHNIFGYMNNSVGETEAPQSSIFSHVSSPQKQLTDSSLDQLANEAHSEKPEELCNVSENLINESQVINDVNNSEATKQGDLKAVSGEEESVVSDGEAERERKWSKSNAYMDIRGDSAMLYR
ncbi:hypothetical protein SESBI_15126 [Sesbania bispinosa]|nr:hypothetical protein SESBI_15126 [Sesbania bispinosa]